MLTKIKICIVLACLPFNLMTARAEPLEISGIYPSLAMFNGEGECGTGALVPWADRLWVITYGPHRPYGSSDKLYEITPDLRQLVRPESIGGTPADRMIHRESQQLIIGPYLIDTNRNVRVIPWQKMPGRLTAVARHLNDPTNKVYFATMEAGLYEMDVKTLEVTGLLKDRYNHPKPGALCENRPATSETKLPGWHGKGLYSAQSRLVFANNGEHGKEADTNPDTVSGALGEWFGSGDYSLVRRTQFAEITGPGGIYGNAHPATDPIWSLGWDRRSLILMCLDRGEWNVFRLPKPDHSYDGAHGWFTEWPRIREVGENDLLMTMHGAFWHFPKNFCVTNSAGIAPRSAYLKIIGDFCRWNDRIVLGCDDAAILEVKRQMKGLLAPTGRSQSNLQFLHPAQLDELGPVLGHGAVWLDNAVKAGGFSEPFLFSGFTYRALWLAHDNPHPVTFTLEVDARGNGDWKKLRDITVPANGSIWAEFTPAETGAWVRISANQGCNQVTAFFQFRNADYRPSVASEIFAGIARAGDTNISGGLLHQRSGNARTLECISADGQTACYELDGDLHLRPTNDLASVVWAKTSLAIPRNFLTADSASVICIEGGHRWRLPKGDSSFEQPGAGADERVCREVVTERDLFNAYGTFYELPAESAGGFSKIRPVTTHNLHVKDYASYRGLLVISGIAAAARGAHIVRSDDGRCALWVGAVDDLWQLGKPRGRGGPWLKTSVKANLPSDAYLCTGYDHKHLILSHSNLESVLFKIEADITGTGKWCPVTALEVKPGEKLEYNFPDAFAAYWLRVISSTDTKATAQFDYY